MPERKPTTCVRHIRSATADLSLSGVDAVKYGVCRKEFGRAVAAFGHLGGECIKNALPPRKVVQAYHEANAKLSDCVTAARSGHIWKGQTY